jgi:hypothetical protein
MTATSTRRTRKFYTRAALAAIAAPWVIRECTDRGAGGLLIFLASSCNGYTLRGSNRSHGNVPRCFMLDFPSWHRHCSTSDLIANMKGGSP